MTLTKAIEILELNIQEAGNKMPLDCKQAIQLGIDALQFFVGAQWEAGGYQELRLSGETQE